MVRPGDTLRIDVQVPHADVVLLQLVGDLDLLSAPALRRQVTRRVREHHHVVVDLAAVDFLSSVGLQTLLDAHCCAAEHMNRLHLTGTTHRPVARPLQLSGLDRVLNISEQPATTLAARLARTTPS